MLHEKSQHLRATLFLSHRSAEELNYGPKAVMAPSDQEDERWGGKGPRLRSENAGGGNGRRAGEEQMHKFQWKQRCFLSDGRGGEEVAAVVMVMRRRQCGVMACMGCSVISSEIHR